VGIYTEGEAPPTAHELLWVCMLVWASASRRARTGGPRCGNVAVVVVELAAMAHGQAQAIRPALMRGDEACLRRGLGQDPGCDFGGRA